jgi:hypothetical protein
MHVKLQLVLCDDDGQEETVTDRVTLKKDPRRRKTTAFRPLSSLPTASVAPELLFMETKGASRVAHGMTVNALKDFLPLDVTLDVKTVRRETLKVTERCEAERGDGQRSRNWQRRPNPQHLHAPHQPSFFPHLAYDRQPHP